MRKVFFLSTIFFILTAGIVHAQAARDIQLHPICPYCGMDRQHCAGSRVLIEYEDGTTFGACSLRCAALDMAVKTHTAPRSILVANFETRKLIDAESAFWVIGGNLAGVMTGRPKWAFPEKRSALTFIQEHGGELVTFDRAVADAYLDMYADSRMIRAKRKIKKMIE